jgi:LCP family protein required for cell wall assembly
MVRPGSPGSTWGPAGKAGYALSCVAAALVLAVSGFSYFVVRDVSLIGGSHAISSGPSIGAQNILLMGLESRTDWNGNILPNNILSALHAGSAAGVANGVGGNATNTLILLHIPAGGTKAVGFSIPRDDYVTFPTAYDGESQGKIDQAYGLAMAAEENQLRTQDPGMSQNQVAYEGNEAGRKAAVDTVESLTGVTIDHFAEINLDGFYELASVLGGVEVCLNHPVPYDVNSGFSAKKAGRQHLNAKLALAFVRQRDGLANGDLDRTHRQQAFLDSVMQQLRNDGVLSDLSKINALLSVAKQYVITDSGWDLLDFASQMRSLTSGNLTFHTLPIVAYQTINGEDVNEINPSYIQQIVHQTFYPPAASASSSASPKPTPESSADAAKTTVDVQNGGNTQGLATEVQDALVKDGYQAGAVGNAPTALTTTEVLYGTGGATSASHIASLFKVTATASATVAPGHVEIELGSDATLAEVSGTPSASSSAVAIPTSGAQGGAVNAKNGIPCVNLGPGHAGAAASVRVTTSARCAVVTNSIFTGRRLAALCSQWHVRCPSRPGGGSRHWRRSASGGPT